MYGLIRKTRKTDWGSSGRQMHPCEESQIEKIGILRLFLTLFLSIHRNQQGIFIIWPGSWFPDNCIAFHTSRKEFTVVGRDRHNLWVGNEFFSFKSYNYSDFSSKRCTAGIGKCFYSAKSIDWLMLIGLKKRCHRYCMVWLRNRGRDRA